MAVRAAKIEIAGFGKASGRRDNWRQMAIDCQRMTNRIWQIWLVHHATHGTADKLRAHFEAYREWDQAPKDERGPKPKWPCKPLEPPLTHSPDDQSFYRILSREFPGINARTRGLLLNAWQSRLSKRKAASGALPGWVSILFGNESVPSFHKPQPIPFDKQNASLRKDDDKYILRLRIDRDEDTGRSEVEDCELILRKRKCGHVRSVVDKILSGEYAWKGSNLVLKNGKWFAMVSYEMPKRERSNVDPEKVLFVRPGSRWPWRVRHMGGRGSFSAGGNGRHVDFARRAIDRETIGRKEHYRWAGSNQKGHGGDRARSVWVKLSSRWKDFQKRYNSEVARRVTDIAIREGCGRIIYLQPRDGRRDSRFLSGGQKNGRTAGWDYFAFGTMLASKCEEEGIEFGKGSGDGNRAKKPKATTRGVRRVRKPSKPKHPVGAGR